MASAEPTNEGAADKHIVCQNCAEKKSRVALEPKMSDFLFFGRIQFDFLQPHYTDDTHVDDQQQIIRLHGAKYRRIVETVVDNPELGMIAGGYFTKYLDGRAQDVDLYISYTGKENPPSDELLNSLLRPKFRSAPFVSSSHLSVLRQKKIVLPGGIGCWVRITTAKSLHEVLATFNWRPAQIGYSFSDHQLLFGPWFRTGGPMYNGSFALQSNYVKKGFTEYLEKPFESYYPCLIKEVDLG